MIRDINTGGEILGWRSVADEILRLSNTFTTSTSACSRGVLVSAPCLPSDACSFCPGLRRLKLRDSQPVQKELL
jgi:hypothetical protein